MAAYLQPPGRSGVAPPRFRQFAREHIGKLLTGFEQEMADAWEENLRLKAELEKLESGNRSAATPVLLTTPRLDSANAPWPQALMDSLPSLCEQYIEMHHATAPEDELQQDAASHELTGLGPSSPKPSNTLPLDSMPQPSNYGGVHIGDEAQPDAIGEEVNLKHVPVKFKDGTSFESNSGKHVAQEVRTSGELISLTPRADIQPTEIGIEEVHSELVKRQERKLISTALDQSLWKEAEGFISQSRQINKKSRGSTVTDERAARVSAEVVAQTYQREVDVKRMSKAIRNSTMAQNSSLEQRRRSKRKDSAKNADSGAVGVSSVDSGAVVSAENFNTKIDAAEEALRIANETGPTDIVCAALNEDEEEDDGPMTCQRRMAALVSHIYFDIFFGLVIIVNSVFMGVQIDFSVSHPDAETPGLFYALSYLFTLVFSIELCIRMIAEKSIFRFMWGTHSWHWNWLDIFIVTSSLVELVFDIIYFTSSHAAGGVTLGQMRIVRIIRLTRLLRVLRIGRIVRFIRALRILVFSILNTLRTVFWALLLLVMIIYVFGMIFAQVVSDHISSSSTDPGELGRYWGSLPRSIFTLFKAIASGVSWHDVVEPLGVLNPMWVGLFVIYISFTFFAVLNVITGIFCERAIESVRQDHELVVQQHLLNRALYIQTVKRLFKAIDVDDSNFISYKEFELHLRDEHAVAFFAALELETSDAWEVFRLIDTDEQDGIDVDEFVEGCLRLRGAAKAIDIAKMGFEIKKFHEGILRMLKSLGLAVEKTHKAAREVRELYTLTSDMPLRRSGS